MTRLILTRPRDQANVWLEQLARRGVEALNLPLLDVRPAPDPAPVHRAWSLIAQGALDAVMFVSPSAVEQFFERRGGQGWHIGTLAVAPGPGTLGVLQRRGVPEAQCLGPNEAAEQFDSEALWEVLRVKPWANRQVLVVRGEGGRDWLTEQWLAAGAQVHVVQAYQRGPAVWDAQQQQVALGALARPGQHVWLFSSSEGLRHLPDLMAPVAPWPAVCRSLRVAVTHPRIAQQAEALGLGGEQGVETVRPDLDSVVRCLQSSHE